MCYPALHYGMEASIMLQIAKPRQILCPLYSMLLLKLQHAALEQLCTCMLAAWRMCASWLGSSLMLGSSGISCTTRVAAEFAAEFAQSHTVRASMTAPQRQTV